MNYDNHFKPKEDALDYACNIRANSQSQGRGGMGGGFGGGFGSFGTSGMSDYTSEYNGFKSAGGMPGMSNSFMFD